MEPLLRVDFRDDFIPGVAPPRPNISALARRLLEALLESLFEMTSRDDGAGRWNGVLEVGPSNAGSSEDIIRGVAVRDPQVMSCFTAAGPSCSGVGEGRFGTSEKEDDDGSLG